MVEPIPGNVQENGSLRQTTMSESSQTTLRDVASEAGVSESTASRALSGYPGIANDTRNRIFQIAEQLGYKKSRRRMGESNDRRGLIGVVVAALHNSFYPSLVSQIHDELEALGFDTILIIDDTLDFGSGRKLQSLINTSLDGVIFATASIESPAVDFLVEHRVPTVLAIRSNKRGNVDVVESDNYMAGVEAARHLIELGHYRIGFILGPRDTSTSVDRYSGCLKECEAAGFDPLEDHVIWSGYSHDAGYSGIVRLMNTPNPPTAVFCANDVIAMGALDACHKLGFAVPEDVSIIGVDDIPMASWSIIGLTTIRQSIREIGILAARRIVTRVNGKGPESVCQDILPTNIVRRRTTAQPPTEKE